MEPLPDDVAARLVEALGAYLRAVPPLDLPASVRPLRGFRSKALLERRGPVLALLDDAARRARILEWLSEGRHPLSRPQSKALEVACRRGEGWVQELEARSRPARPGRKQAAPGPARDGTREKELLGKARDDARRARDDAAAARAETRSLGKEAAGLRAALDAARRDAGRAGGEAAREQSRLERELRKARRDAERSEAERDRARTEARAASRRAAALDKELAEARRRPSSEKPRRPRTPAPKTARRRRALPAPKGLLATDPETLDAWLEHSDVTLLVDGYNVTKAEGGWDALSLEAQRDRLIAGLGVLARRKGTRAIVVFDGAELPPGRSRRARGPVQVEYSRPPEIADDHVVARLDQRPHEPVIVVSNDKELQARAAAKGATPATSQQLLALIR